MWSTLPLHQKAKLPLKSKMFNGIFAIYITSILENLLPFHNIQMVYNNCLNLYFFLNFLLFLSLKGELQQAFPTLVSARHVFQDKALFSESLYNF